MRVLLIESEERLQRNLGHIFQEVWQCSVDIATNDDEQVGSRDLVQYDLVIVDLNETAGALKVQALRRHFPAVPILVLLARADKSHIIELLNEGADDCMSKPFDYREMAARCAALMRRSGN